MKRGAGIACALMLVAVATTSAQTFSLGEIVLTGRRLSDNRGVIVVHSPDGTFARTMLDFQGDLFDLGFGANGLLYAAGGSVIAYRANGTTVYVFPAESDGAVRDLGFASDGRIYALWSSNRVVVYGAEGTRLAGFDLPGTVSSIDLAVDQCTLWFTTLGFPSTSDSAVARANLCSAAPLAPVSLRTYPGPIGTLPQDVRVLPSGQLLVARWLAGVEILDGAGAVVRSFTTPATELAIAPDGRSFYASMGAAPVQRIDLTTGTVLQTFSTGVGIRGIAVFGDPRAAFAAAAGIPLASEGLLALLVAALGGLAVVILRRL